MSRRVTPRRLARQGARRYLLIPVCDVLGDEGVKMYGYQGADPVSFSVEDLLACGVSDDGIDRVIRQAKVQREPAAQVEPRLPSGVFVHEREHLVDGVLVRVEVEDASIEVQFNHDSSPSVGDERCTPDTTEGEPLIPGREVLNLRAAGLSPEGIGRKVCHQVTRWEAQHLANGGV
jgi:hypothetical protein